MKPFKDLTQEEQITRMTASFVFGSIARKDIISAYYAENSPKFEKIIEAVKNISDADMEQLSDEMMHQCCSNFHEILKCEVEKKKLI